MSATRPPTRIFDFGSSALNGVGTGWIVLSMVLTLGHGVRGGSVSDQVPMLLPFLGQLNHLVIFGCPLTYQSVLACGVLCGFSALLFSKLPNVLVSHDPDS